jgi:ferredoxin
MTWRVRVDAGLRIGSGMCVAAAPDRFAFDPGQRSRPVSNHYPERTVATAIAIISITSWAPFD